VLPDRAQEFFGNGGIAERAVEQRFQVAVDDGNGRAQLVRDVRDELAPDRL
jgi:hypothetical protein